MLFLGLAYVLHSRRFVRASRNTTFEKILQDFKKICEYKTFLFVWFRVVCTSKPVVFSKQETTGRTHLTQRSRASWKLETSAISQWNERMGSAQVAFQLCFGVLDMQNVRRTVLFRVLLQFECIVHMYAIFISMAKHRCKILHWAARSNLSNMILKQVNRYIFSPGVHHQDKRLHIYYGLALDMIENGGISVFVLHIQYALQICFSATSNILYS